MFEKSERKSESKKKRGFIFKRKKEREFDESLFEDELFLTEEPQRDFELTSSSSFSTVTHNSSALSSLSFKANASSRFDSPELQIFQSNLPFSFFVSNSLLKVEKPGFFSCQRQVQRAMRNLEAATEDSFSAILQVLRRLHSVGFEANFERLVGENLCLLQMEPSLLQNSYHRFDVKFGVEVLRDFELQTHFEHDFSLKLCLLPHFREMRSRSFAELLSNERLSRDFEESRKREELCFGGKDVSSTRAPLLPKFEERSLSQLQADLIFNEGLLILSVPFRESREEDALFCFQSALSLFPPSADAVRAKCSLQSGVCLFRLGRKEEAAEALRQALAVFKSFHGELSNNCDVARVLSAIGSVERSLRWHQRSLQMFRDSLGSSSSFSSAFAKALLNFGKTLAEREFFDKAEESFLEALFIFEALSKKLSAFKQKVGLVSLNLASLYLKRGEREKFLSSLNAALKAFEEFCRFEMSVLNRKEEERSTSVDLSLSDLAPHSLLLETLVAAADILSSTKSQGFEKVAEELLLTALTRYESIFSDFYHPKVKEIEEKIQILLQL